MSVAGPAVSALLWVGSLVESMEYMSHELCWEHRRDPATILDVVEVALKQERLVLDSIPSLLVEVGRLHQRWMLFQEQLVPAV